MRWSWLGLCLALAGTGFADEQSARSCTRISDKAARLACYDAAMGGAAETKPARPPAPDAPVAASQSAAAPSPPPVVKTGVDAFGDTGNLRGTRKPVLPKRIVATITHAVPLGHGLYEITLDNGQVWRTTEADWVMDFDSGGSVTISRMMIGNYLISQTGQGRTVSVKRVQ